MTRVLVLSVGGSSDPLVHAIDQNKPDHVYFICSTGEGHHASDKTIEQRTTQEIKVFCSTCKKDSVTNIEHKSIVHRADLSSSQYSIMRIVDPDELPEVLTVCKQIEDEICERFGDMADVIANYTGGTKTMSLGLGLYTIRTGGRWSPQVNKANRTDLIKVKTGDMAFLQDVNGLLAQDALARAWELECSHDYNGAATSLQPIFTGMQLPENEKAEIIKRYNYYTMMDAWDRLDYEKALELCKANEQQLGEFGKSLSRLRGAAKRFLSDMQWSPKDNSGFDLVRDLLDNASRRAEAKRYDDAVARFYRATELLAQVQLRRCYGINTSNVALENESIPEKSRSWLEGQRNVRNNKISIGLFAAYRLLHEMGDPVGGYFEETKKTLHDVIEIRNMSLFAHGLTPVTHEIWQRIGSSWQSWLQGALERVDCQ